MSIRLALAASVLAAVTVAAAPPLAPAAAPAPVCGPKARKLNTNLTLKDVAGKPVSLKAYAGKVVLFDFWATWCGPCKLEIPGFVDLYTRYKDKGFEVVGLITEDPISNVPAFAQQFKMNYTILDANGRDDVEDAFGTITGLPTSFLVSRDGRICTSHMGYEVKEEFEREIQELLALPAAPAPAPGHKTPPRKP